MKSLKNLINDRLMISIRRFSQEIGISRQTICNIMADKGTPTVLTVKKSAPISVRTTKIIFERASNESKH